MATNKEKLLASAQKNLKKKQVVKAIKDYVQIVKLDPADVRSRQKLAELYVRSNKNSDAYEQYESIAKYFASNGFYLKAIAIYKLMQRLDPDQIAIFNRLAELNEKQGLIGNAMAEYRNLVDYYGRNGMVADEIKTLEKMRDLDLNNLNVRVKLAEVYAANEREDEGFEELESVLEILSDKGDFDKILKLYKMFIPMYPDSKKLQMGLALALYEKGDLGRGVTILEGLLKDKPDDPDLLRLLGRGYADLKKWKKSCSVYEQLLAMDTSDLDARALLVEAHLGNGTYVLALEELEQWKDAFYKADRIDDLTGYYELLKDKLDDTSVVLQALDSIYELTGEGDKLLDIISEQEAEPEESVDNEMLSDILLGSVDEDDSGADELILSDESNELIFDIVEDDDVDLELESSLAEDTDNEIADQDAVIELDIDTSFDLGDENDDVEFSFDLEDDNDSEKVEEPVTEVVHNLQGDLEEAEFYMQQGLYTEAKKKYSDILTYESDYQECLDKINEIELLQQKSEQSTATDDSDLAGFGDIDFDFETIEPDEETGKKIFKTDVDEQIAADDMESHYNLGIAYREMGLFDDAVSEFEKAEKEPSRFVDCQTLKGLCYRDKGDFENAEEMFKNALASVYLEEMQSLNLGYELGLLYECSNRAEEALSSYQIVFGKDSNYRDVRDKIAILENAIDAVDDGSIDALEESKDRISFL